MVRHFLAVLLATLAVAAPAAAQNKAGKADFKPPPKLPAMAPAAVIPGTIAPTSDEDILFLDLSSGGRVKIVLRPDAAPKHVERIKTLVRQGFYDGTIFHRVIEGFMAQGGDPTGTGQGGSKLPDLEPEFNELPHVRGALSMARAQAENSANSQFFIIFQPTLKLDRQYTIWGRVIDGMQWVDAIARGEPPENPTRIVKASIAADKVPPPAPATPIPATALSLPPTPPTNPPPR
ncbi:peptidylprolyl isomerase [alpha proteobacterium AAP81b]|nr:peptidylprolyl isomerase [alpha proteobacterium AAP81b]